MSMTVPLSPTADERLQAATELLAPWAQANSTPEPGRLDVSLAATDLPVAVGALARAHWGRLAAITGLDLLAPAAPSRPAARGAAPKPAAPPTTDLEVLYHVCAGAAVLTLRVRVPRDAPSVSSIQDILPYAAFFERELHEMFGVEIVGAPNLDRLLLSDDWPDGVYPLRQDAVMPPTPGRAD